MKISAQWKDDSMVDETNEDEVNQDDIYEEDKEEEGEDAAHQDEVYGDVLDEDPRGNITLFKDIKVFSFNQMVVDI